MATGLQGPPRLWLRILLWLVGAVMLAVLALLIGMEYSVEKNGGGEMVDTIGLLFGLMLIAYYTVVLFLGRIMLCRGGVRWGWHLVAVMLLLVFLPPLILWKLAVG